MGKKLKNRFYLTVFCALIGACAGAIIWLFLKAVAMGTQFLWEWLPGRVQFPFYAVIACTAGGLIIGLFHRKFGDYPEELDVVLGKVKTEKWYDYHNMPVLLAGAFLPLIIGSSVGREAGLTGVIVGLCYWAGDNLKFARQNAKEYSEIGMAVTLSVLFHSPLFGIFAVEEENEGKDSPSLPGTSKIFIYGIALAAGTGIYMLLSALCGGGMGAFPSFSAPKPENRDYLMLVVYILLGCILAKFYWLTHDGARKCAEKMPTILKETAGGLCLGIAGALVPAAMFSGEEQMGKLIAEYGQYLPWMLAGVAFLKVLLTNVCIWSGLKGGHFFPVIFSGVCLGYAAASFAFPNSAEHVAFAAAIVTAALLGGVMKKPLAVTMLLFLCFPVKLFVWIFVAAAVGSRCFSRGKTS